MAAKVHFTNNRSELEDFIAPNHLIKELEGDENWAYKYVEPSPGENDKMKDTQTRDRLLVEREELVKKFEQATREWIRHPEGEQGKQIKSEREKIAKLLKEDYWHLDPYMGLGTYIGYFVSQNGLGHVLGHVKDVGDDATQIDKVRIYRTTARQFFHADDSDIVGLLCVHRAREGGESDIVSIHNVWNDLQKNNPDVAELLTKPVWYFDRKGETSVGEEEWIRTSIFYLENGGQGRVYCKWDPYFVRSLTRFSDKGIIPALSEEQKRAITILEETCQKLALHMVLEVGDIQFVSNTHLLHARTAYTGKHLFFLFLIVGY